MSWLSDPRVKVFVNEALVHRRVLVFAFVAINLVMLIAAFMWPKGYVANTTIVASERNVIQPLMQGAAVTTEVTDRARMARELMNGRKVMNQVIVVAGWLPADATDKEKNNVVASLNARTKIANVGRNLILIEYRDSQAERAYRTTKAIADIFIQEGANAKAAESQAAFDFIDKQTQEYHQKLASMESGLKEFHIANIDVRPGSDGDISQRMSALQQRIETARQELSEAEVKKKSLERQLSGEAEVATAISREGQYRQRIAELTNQLETLRMSYLDTYPDVVSTRHQIEDLKRAIEEDRKRRETAKAAGHVVIDDSVINNPMYQQLKRDLSQNQITIDTLKARIAETSRQLDNVLERGKKARGGEATLAELTRDYQVTRDIYQDLLRRRENARVSMNIDKENQGLTFKIQEPATLPLQPSGLQFSHFILLGLVLGVGLPAGLIYGWTQVDPRLRQPSTLSDRHKLPMMVVVPHLWTPQEMISVKREVDMGVLLLAGTFALIGLAIVVRVAGAYFQ